MAQVGDRIPDVEVRVLGADGPEVVKTGEVLGSGKVVLFAVPGAFAPGCSKVHLPGYVANADDLKAKGVTAIVCIAVNDVWTMAAWAQAQGVGDKIVMLADGNGDFARAMGLVLDGTGIGMGNRSRRYAAVIEDGVITSLEVDEPGKVDVSTCEAVIEKV